VAEVMDNKDGKKKDDGHKKDGKHSDRAERKLGKEAGVGSRPGGLADSRTGRRKQDGNTGARTADFCRRPTRAMIVCRRLRRPAIWNTRKQRKRCGER